MIPSNGPAPSEADLLRAMLDAREELRQARAWTAGVLDAIGDGVAVFNGDGTIAWINERAAAWLGHGAAVPG